MVPSEEITVVIGHPYTLLREGIARILADGGFRVIGHTCDLTNVHNISINLHPDIILLDIGMAGYCSAAIRELEDKTTIIVIIASPDTSEQAAEAIQSGAKGYLSVNQSSQEFIQALHVIARGDIIVSKEATKTLKDSFSLKKPSDHQGNLTNRENDILSLLSGGLTNREIGERLFVSEHTVKVHLRAILTKLNLRNRQQAAAYAARFGIVK